MAECQNVTAAWGSLCPDCGQRLPKPFSPKAYFDQRARDKDNRLYLWRNVTDAELADREAARGNRAPKTVPVPLRLTGVRGYKHPEVATDFA